MSGTTIETEKSKEKMRVRTPSRSLCVEAARTVADSCLACSSPEKRARIQKELAETVSGVEADSRQFVLAALKEAGLGYKKTDKEVHVKMRQPRLSNPDPGEFSTALCVKLPDPQATVELLMEQGRELLAQPNQIAEMETWLENMEAATNNQVT